MWVAIGVFIPLTLLMGAATASTTPAELAAVYEQAVDRRLSVPSAEVRRYGMLAQAMLLAHGIGPIAPQFLVLVDSSPQVQALLLLWLAPASEPLLIGASPVSTGRTGEYDYFETPTGVYPHNTTNPDFRSEGTYNENGIRGFGAPGLRVFDFGWQPGLRGWGAGGTSPMRLLLHATDPDRLEPLLGTVQSKGCIRIPATLVQLLDHYGVLDAGYEEAIRAGRHFWVLSPRRTPVHGPGRYLVIVDTSRAERPPWSPLPAAVRTPTPAPP